MLAEKYYYYRNCYYYNFFAGDLEQANFWDYSGLLPSKNQHEDTISAAFSLLVVITADFEQATFLMIAMDTSLILFGLFWIGFIGLFCIVSIEY